MDIVDFILFPLFFFLFYRFTTYRLKKISDPILKVYYKRAFFIRVLSCFAFSIFLVYISPGDSFGTYYMQGLSIYKQSLKDPSIIQQMIFTKANNINETLFNPEAGGSVVFLNENNYMPARIAAIFMFFSFGKYLITNLFFSMLAFEGCWRLYKFFYDQYPTLHRQLAYAILYFPTFVFWSSGISKEAICVASIGFITYGMYSIFIKKKKVIINVILLFLFTYLLINIKIYIILSYLPFLIYFITVSSVLKVKNKVFKLIIGPIIIATLLIGISAIIIYNNDNLGLYAVDGLSESIQRQQTNFQLQENIAESNFELGGEFDGSFISLLKLAPAAINATLFRPYLWEVRKISTLLSAIESLLLIILTFYVLIKVKFTKIIYLIIKKPIIAYCFSFAILFSLFVGITTLNFGSLVRYKIPCLPFYVVSMFLILHYANLSKSTIKSFEKGAGN